MFIAFEKGDTGNPGRFGFQGVTGEMGDRGTNGGTGRDGFNGPKGEPGMMGMLGFPGKQGPDGIPGFIGRPGYPGIKSIFYSKYFQKFPFINPIVTTKILFVGKLLCLSQHKESS